MSAKTPAQDQRADAASSEREVLEREVLEREGLEREVLERQILEHEVFAREVLAGLSKARKSIPCQYFYDEAGSLLFEHITELPEYYPTRTELAILRDIAPDIASRTKPHAALVEFGSGSSLKTEILLSACPALERYVPIDVSHTILDSAKTRLEAKYPYLRVEPVIGDFMGEVKFPADLNGLPKIGFFPGSTIGNFDHRAAVGLLTHFRALLGPGSRLIVGADLRKSPDILIPAYDDAAGVTAAFNVNLLTRINRELGATFETSKFEHLATYDIAAGRIDMFLVSRTAQDVEIAGHRFTFAEGERIHTEISQKYAVEELQGLAEQAGWTIRAAWTDPARLFSVHEFAC